MSARLSQCEWAEEGKVRNVFIPSFFRSKPKARRRTSPCHAMHCRRGGRVTMHSPGQTATKARGQNTGHDRVARCHTCYLDDRVHGEQRQRARSSLLRRHRWCHCRRDIPGIWRFGLLPRRTNTRKKGWTATNCRCRRRTDGARSSNRLLGGAVAIAARYSHSVHCAIIIEVSGVHTAQHTRGIRDCSLDASLGQRPIWPAR